MTIGRREAKADLALRAGWRPGAVLSSLTRFSAGQKVLPITPEVAILAIMPCVRRVPSLRAGTFLHPADKQALEILRRLPWVQPALEYISSHAFERAALASLLANTVKTGPGVHARLATMLAEICSALEVECPLLFVEADNTPRIYTLGCRRTAIVISHGLLAMLDGDEINGALAHEACHLVCGHLPYLMLCECGRIFARMAGPIGLPFMPAQLALEEWRCRAAFSCDRGALLLLGDEKPLVGMLAKQAGAMGGEADTQAIAAQRAEFEKLIADFPANHLARAFLYGDPRHTLSALRLAELSAWMKSAEYEALASGRETADATYGGAPLWGEFAPYASTSGGWETAAASWGATWGEIGRRFAATAGSAAPEIAAALGKTAAAFLRGLQEGRQKDNKASGYGD